MVDVKLPHGRWGQVHITELGDEMTSQPLRKFAQGQIRTVQIIKKVGDDLNAPIRCSFRLKPEEERQPESVDAQHVEIRKAAKVSGYVVGSGDKGVFVALTESLTARIQLKNTNLGTGVKGDVVAQKFPIGKFVENAAIVSSPGDEKIELSLRAIHTGESKEGVVVQKKETSDGSKMSQKDAVNTVRGELLRRKLTKGSPPP